MKKLFAAAGVVVALGAGAFALSTVMPAGAQTDSGGSTASSDVGPAKPGRGERIKSVLDGLVTDGTISQEQEDKIIAALKAAAPEGGPGHPGRGFGRGAKVLKQAAETAASALNISVDDLKAELKAGKSVADVATEKGVPLDTVTKALTDAATARIDAALSSGKIDQAQADKAKAALPGLIDRLEQGTLPRFGDHGGDGETPDDAGSTSSSS